MGRLYLCLAALFLALVVFVGLYVQSRDLAIPARVARMQEEAAHVEALAEAKQATNERMRREIQALRDNPRYLGVYARQHLGMIGPDELVLHVKE
jgi:cell division protein FtsB